MAMETFLDSLIRSRWVEGSVGKSSGKEQEQRRKLLQQLTSLRADLRQLDETSDREQQAIDEQALAETRERLQDLKLRNTLLKAFLLRTVNKRQVLQEHRKKVADRLHVFRQISSKAEEEVGFGSAQDGLTCKSWPGTSPEPEVLQDVRGTCFTRYQLLKTLYDDQESPAGDSSDDSRDLRSANYQRWLSQVEGVNATHPPNHVLTALESLAAENKEELVELHSKVDVLKDMETLRFCYSSSHLQDMSEPPAVLRSVKSLLEEGWRDCEVRVVEKIGAVRREKEMNCRLTSLAREFNLLLQEQYGHDTELLTTCREAFELELSVSERRGYQQELMEQAHLLANSMCAKNREVQSLQQKHARILDFQALVDSKQDLIRVLVKGNSSAKSHLMKTQTEIASFVEQKLGKHEETIRCLTEELHNSICRELNVFAAISLACLDQRLIQEVQRVPVHKLSIHRLDTSSNNPQFFQQFKKNLSFPLYKAPEHLIDCVTKMKMEVQALRAMIFHQRGALQALQIQHNITPVTDAQALIERIQQQNEECAKNCIPVIEKLLKKCNQAIEFTDELRDDVQDWWEQPAQFLVPWVKQYGLNVQGWIQKWSELIHWGLMHARREEAEPQKPC
ncbi:HAUS augmin-like complex subunit 5 [Heterodontus francisci]|uniref:HAUS augmin-like complex subunit 5 n=1 Tax=Heterodontus francisci TaxID=7792 RepID=UPI00355C09FE